MSDDNTQDGAEPSPASAGSRPVAWVAFAADASESRALFLTREAADRAARKHGWFVAELFARPTLTVAEREAIERLCEAVAEYSDIDRKENGCHADDDMAAVAVARGLLKRMA